MAVGGSDTRAPDQAPAAAHRRALQLHAAGRLDAAVAAYRAVLKRHPGACDCWCNLGAALRTLGRPDEGLQALREGLRACPRHAGLVRNLGNALADNHDWEGARAHHEQAVERFQATLHKRPDNAGLYAALGWSLWKLDRLEAAAAAYRRAVAADPAATVARLETVLVLTALGRYAESERLLRAAVPQSPAVQAALGQALIDQGRLDAGLACAEAVLARDPAHADARMARARAHFLAGRYAAAWPDYAFRVSARRRRLPPGVAERHWRGEALEGRSILLYREQGLGDVIQCVRYAPLLAQRGAEVFVSAPPPLVGLLRRLPAVAGVVSSDEPHAWTDWTCSLLDVAGVCRTDLDSIPGDCPYLPARRSPPLLLLLPPTGQFRVGIVWAGSPNHGRDHERSCRLDDFAPLFELPGTEFISFQVGPRARDLSGSGWRGLVRAAPTETVPFEATADALAEVDLVITVDTALAHLAGALGRPVWTLLSFAPDWRWMLDRADTPWYPTMRLFRQPRPNDWAGVFREVRRELAAKLAQPHGARDP